MQPFLLHFIKIKLYWCHTIMSTIREDSQTQDCELLLNQFYKKLHAVIDIDTICKETVTALLDFFNINTIFIAVYYPEKHSFSFPVFISDKEEVRVHDVQENTGLVSLVLQKKQPIIVQHNAHEFFASHNAVKVNKNREPKSWVGFPITINDEILGVLSLQDYEYENFFTEKDIAALTIIAESIAKSIKTARDYSFMKRQAENSALLVNVINSLQMIFNNKHFFDTYAEKLSLLVPQSLIAIYAFDSTKQYYKKTTVTDPALNNFLPESVSSDTLKLINTKDFFNGMIDNKGSSVFAQLLKISDNCQYKLMTSAIFSNHNVMGFPVILRMNDENDFTNWELDICNIFSKYSSSLYNNILAFEETQSVKTEAENANKIKSQFLATMSHELRTPLNSIINFAFLLLQEVEGPITPEQRELLSRIEVSGKHLLSLINDILDLAKIESGKMELYLEETDTTVIMKEMLGVTESLIQNKPITLIYNANTNLPTIKADRVRLRQVLLNILSNAVKFTDKGSITITIIPEDSFLVFTIEDTGIGISEEEKIHLFKDFVQLDTGYARKAGGTGLGLSIAKRFIELHGGTITIDSIKNKGTKVSFSIPIYSAGQ